MPKYSIKSKDRLNECDPRLIDIFNEVIKHFDCSIVTGHRNEYDQNKKYEQGYSKVVFPNSKHNSIPSKAVDTAPYPIDWGDRERFTLFAGYVLGIAAIKGIDIRWGGDWDRDTNVDDNVFDDLAHFELMD